MPLINEAALCLQEHIATPADIDMLFATEWKVHFNSSRTGVRLIGPKPQWARADGGDRGGCRKVVRQPRTRDRLGMGATGCFSR